MGFPICKLVSAHVNQSVFDTTRRIWQLHSRYKGLIGMDGQTGITASPIFEKARDTPSANAILSSTIKTLMMAMLVQAMKLLKPQASGRI